MSVKIRPSKDNKSWEYDIHATKLDGTKIRERRKITGLSSRYHAQRWAEEREYQLLIQILGYTPKDSGGAK